MRPSLLAAIKPSLEPAERPFLNGPAQPTGQSLLDFWRWMGSDLFGNTLRPMIAEFIVAKALGDKREVREEWAPCDVLMKDGGRTLRIEVKSTCAVQSWKQAAPSKAIFNIGPARAWLPAEGRYVGTPSRNADVFVFAQLVVGDEIPDPLDLAQWRFFVLPTHVIDDRAPKAKSVALSTVMKWGAVEVGYEGLKEGGEDGAGKIAATE